jgi:hypothetical protein
MESPVTIVTGTPEDLDAAYSFCQGALKSLFGENDGEEMFKTMPAICGMVLYAWALQNMGEA